MARMVGRGQRVVVRVTMGAKTLPDADSFNTVAEIKGWLHPEQVGLHIPTYLHICPGGLAVALTVVVSRVKGRGTHSCYNDSTAVNKQIPRCFTL